MSAPPPRPPRWEERAAQWMLLAFGPRLPRPGRTEPPALLAPWERVALPRRGRGGALDATWFPAQAPRGAVLLVHPWLGWGQAYFHRRGRIQALRAAGYHVLTFDLSGFGASGPPDGLYDRDVEDALAALADRAAGLPLHVWAISSGGHWTIPLLAARDGVAAAMFEDVAPHILHWSMRAAPLFAPAYLAFQAFLPRAFRYLDMRRHVPRLRRLPTTFVSGAADRGILPADTEKLARLAAGAWKVVPNAPHLGAIKLAPREVIGLALETFEQATSRSPRRSAPPSPPPPGTSPAS